eukprot:5986052-Amphidinium_carterae.3
MSCNMLQRKLAGMAQKVCRQAAGRLLVWVIFSPHEHIGQVFQSHERPSERVKWRASQHLAHSRIESEEHNVITTRRST